MIAHNIQRSLPNTLVIASSNAHKISEVQEIMRACAHQLLDGNAQESNLSHVQAQHIASLCVRPLSDFGEAPEPIEDGTTFEENARIKAQSARQFLVSQGMSFPVLADDSGLEVDALEGEPGVLSARYAGRHGDDAANNERVLHELAKRCAHEPHQRRARFVCALCYLDAKGEEKLVRGTVEGYIGQREQGDGGFGYDPLFVSDCYAPLTLAQVDARLKNQVSHRGNALRILVQKLCQA